MVAIVGGAGLSIKLTSVESMLDKVHKLIIGDGIVFTFLKVGGLSALVRGLSVGNSLVEAHFTER